MGRHDRRASLARYRQEASHSLRTYLCAPTDPALDGEPLLKAAARDWIAALPVRVRHCLICNSWIVNQHDVGALLLTVPDITKPVSAGTAAVCKACWDAALPTDALERACATVLETVIPNGKFEPLDPRR
jgi:hypothetical protein